MVRVLGRAWIFILAISFLFGFKGHLAAQTTSVEVLGSISAQQAANGLGFNLDSDQDWEFAAAAAAGATHVRMQCPWNAVEQQTAPPANSVGPVRYVEDPNCVLGFASARKYGLKVTAVAAYGPPYHQILTVILPNGAAVGARSMDVQLVSGVGGDTLANIAFPFDYIVESGGGTFTQQHNYEGSLITAVTVKDPTHATLTLASAVTTALPADASAQYVINEILYPSAATANAADPSVQAYADYVTWLANDMSARGVSGDVEVWNEPPWSDDSWDARGYLYDSFPAGENWSPNFGFAANLQNRTMPSGVTLTWAGTNKSGGNSLLFGPYQPTPMTLNEPSTVFTSESLHPYGNTPEQVLWNSQCLAATINVYPVFPNSYQACYLPGEKVGSDFIWAAQYDLIQKSRDASFGLSRSITETGIIPPQVGLKAGQARFIVRQFLGFEALGITPIDFYKLDDLYAASDPSFSFVQEVGNSGTFIPYPAYTAISGLMADLQPISLPPVITYTASSLPFVTSYSGTYPLSTVHMVGARAGATANSDLFVVWQRSYTPGCATSGGTNASTCDNSWIEQASPSPGIVTVNIPSGYQVTTVVNADTRASVPYTTSGQQITFPVADDPIEILTDPSSTTTTLTVSANPTSSSYGNQVVLTAVLTPYILGACSTDGQSVAFSQNGVSLGTGNLSSGVATLDVTSLPIGTDVVDASFRGHLTLSASSGTTSLAVSPISPQLSFPVIANQILGTTSLNISAISTSPGAVSYSVLSGPAAIAGSVLTPIGVGTVVLQASQIAAGNYSAAEAQTSFAVIQRPSATPTQEPVTLAFTPISDQVYGAAPLTLSATSASSGAVRYVVVGGAGLVSGRKLTLGGVGRVTVVAYQSAAGSYPPMKAQTSFMVNGEAPGLSFVPVGEQVLGAAPFRVWARSSSSGKVTYSVLSGPAHASGATVTATGVGTVVVQATQAASGNWASATSTVSVKVTQRQ